MVGRLPLAPTMNFSTVQTEALTRLKDLLDQPRRLVIVTHFNPDGDAIGSSLGLMHMLRKWGHTVHVVLPNAAPAFLNWLPGASDAIAFDRDPKGAADILDQAEVLFCLDFNRMDRVNALQASLSALSIPRVLIDHHQDPDPSFEYLFSDTTACATCQMVYDLLVAMGRAGTFDTETATCLYTGLVTDSGSFRFRSTTPHTMRVAGDLMAHGVNIERVHQAIMDDNTVDRLRLLGFMLHQRLEVLPESSTSIISLSRADLERYHNKPGDTEGFVNYGLSIRGIRLSAFFVERPDMVKVSLRSKGDLAVDRFLKEHFNGGGHANAAGGHTTGSLEDAVARFRSLLPQLIAPTLS
jgi:phosphoesterase RecJ-like protein